MARGISTVLMVVTVIVAALCIAACAVSTVEAQSPTRPKISEMFYAGLDLDIVLHREKRNIHGRGIWAADQPDGKNYEMVNIDEASHQHYNVRSLLRFDLHKSYEVIDNKTCHVRDEDGPMPMLWGWLSEAAYEGKKTIDGKSFDTWSLRKGYANMTVAVTAETPDYPAYLIVDAPEKNTTVRFLSWNTDKPTDNFFAVPQQCAKSAIDMSADSVACVARNTMISRAEVWVNNRVPYNQQGHYQGYREDCSGYVSMAWGTSKPGYTTFTMHEIAHPIAKDSLEKGDVLLCASEHVVLFGGWSSSDKSHFVAFEETRPGEGTVKRVTPYPYWYNTGCFKPYRFNSVC